MGLFSWLSGLGKKAPPRPPPPPRRETEEETISRRAARAAEVRRGIGKSVQPPADVSGEELFGGKVGRPASPHARRGKGYRSTLTGRLVHADAAFDDEENAAFLLGIKVECRSSWIAAAQWFENRSEMILWMKGSGKDYTFPAIDYQEAANFARSYSKGRWYWHDWKGQYFRGEDEFPLLGQADLPRGR